MKKLTQVVFMFLFSCLLAQGQNLDTITNQTKKPPILDLLSGKSAPLSQSETKSSSPVKKRPLQDIAVTEKVIIEKAPREKAALIRALGQIVPQDQYNVSVSKELTYEVSQYTSNALELPGVLNEKVEYDDGKVTLKDQRTLVRLEIDTTGILGDVKYFERLMYNTLDLDLINDEVSVQIWSFPYSEASQKRRRTSTLTSVPNSNVTSNQESVNNELFSAWWFWAIVGAVILLIIVLVIILSRRKKEVVQEEELVIDNSTFKKMSLSAMDKAPVSLKKNEFKKLLVESAESVASFMENIIESGQEDALTVFSFLAKPYPDLVGQLKPHMAYSSYLTLLTRVDEDIEDKIDPDTQDKFLLTFNNTVKAIANEKNNVERSPDHKVFGFVSQLNDMQIFKLIEGDKPEMSSVLFAQLPGERKLKVMELLDPIDKSELLLKLTDMSRLPLSVIREIGQRYAKKAKEMAGLYNIDIDGIGAIINTLDELEENKQREILETMLQNDLDKGQIVEQKFVGFFNLPKVDEEILQNALMDIDTSELLNALFGSSEEIVESVLKVRPPREREMIKSELESGNTVSNKERADARKVILTNIRKFV
jgi:hypothetical protein